MTRVTLHHGDARDELRRMIDQGVRVHSVVTDPPYYLESVARRFGKAGSAPAKFGTDGAFARQSRGFMGKQWDGADPDGSRIAQDPEFWRLIHDILLPGGFVVAFSSPRTGHWQACAMEQAGLVMHPFIGWCYGSGFPKAHNASKAIDQQLGVERKVVGHFDNTYGINKTRKDQGYRPGDVTPGALTTAGSPEAAAWEGWAYGLQALKPALEPIYVAQRPFSERNGALNLLKHGVGAMNIDGCRVAPVEGETIHAPQSNPHLRGQGAGEYCIATRDTERMHEAQRASVEKANTLGRHPANLIHDGSAAVVGCFPDTKSGTGAVKRASSRDRDGNRGSAYGAESRPEGSEMVSYGDAGSAARFFNALPVGEDEFVALPIWDACYGDQPPFLYHPKATKADRAGSRHPTVKPVALMRWLCRLVTPPGGIVLDPFAGSGTTGRAALEEGFGSLLIERETEYMLDVCRRFGARPITSSLDRETLRMLDLEASDDILELL